MTDIETIRAEQQITTLEDGRISIPFVRNRDQYIFTDAIILSQEERDAMTEEQLSAIMDQRFERWYQVVTGTGE
jgi:hypothetical protein